MRKPVFSAAPVYLFETQNAAFVLLFNSILRWRLNYLSSYRAIFKKTLVVEAPLEQTGGHQGFCFAPRRPAVR